MTAPKPPPAPEPQSAEEWRALIEGRHPPTVGAQIRSLREERRLTQAELADAAGIHVRRVQEVERGANATLLPLQAIADALGEPLVIHPGAARPNRQDGARQAAHRVEQMEEAEARARGELPALCGAEFRVRGRRQVRVCVLPLGHERAHVDRTTAVAHCPSCGAPGKPSTRKLGAFVCGGLHEWWPQTGKPSR